MNTVKSSTHCSPHQTISYPWYFHNYCYYFLVNLSRVSLYMCRQIGTCMCMYYIYSIHILYIHIVTLPLSSLVAQIVKKLPAVQETQVQSLSRANPLEKEWFTHSSILAWRTPWTEEPGHNWATAKLLQSCPTLCNPIDGSPPRSPVPGILQARTLMMMTKSLSRVRLFATPWAVAYQAPLSMGFSRQ